MGIRLSQVVLWGRSFHQYSEMFNLTDDDLHQRVIGIADGPASTNAELRPKGIDYTSMDPIYDMSPEQIEAQYEANFDEVMEKLEASLQYKNVDWADGKTSDELIAEARKVFKDFLDDFRTHQTTNAYQVGELPSLPLSDGAYDLALCSYLLFAYSGLLSFDFHKESIDELLRIAREVRVYPVTDADDKYSDHLKPIMDDLEARGFEVYLEKVTYKKIEHDMPNEMLVARHRG